MICDNCGYANPPGYKYCEKCGAGRDQIRAEQHTGRRSQWGKRLLVLLLLLYPLTLLALSLLNMVEPKRTGLLALSEVFAPYLFLPLLLIAPCMLMRGTLLLRVVLLECMLVFFVRFPPRLVSAAPASDPGALHLSAMQWNVRNGGQYVTDYLPDY